MKSLLLALCLMVSPLSLSASEEVFVVANSANIYAEASYSSEVVISVEYGQALTMLDEQNFDGFYYVSVNGSALQGYVPADLVGQRVQDQDVVLSYNATILQNTQVLALTSDDVLCEIAQGERVYLYEGYNRDADFLAVSFVKDGNVIVGRVNTDYINPDGVNAALIVSITAIVALVTIVIILLGISKKKQKKKKLKSS